MSTPSPSSLAPTLDNVRNGTAVIQFDHKGESVAQVQFLVGAFDDGSFGNNTKNMIAAFQSAQGIVVSEEERGKVNAATLKALEDGYQQTAASLAKIDKRNKKVHLMLEFT